MKAAIAVVLLTLVASSLSASTTHSKEFWKSIGDNKFAMPEGEKPVALAKELTTYFSSPDPTLRDDYAYSILVQWIYVKQLLTPEELRGFIAAWSANLRLGFDDKSVESVLRRSFSALSLATIAAYDN